MQGLFFTFLILQLCEKDVGGCACSSGLVTSGAGFRVFFLFVFFFCIWKFFHELGYCCVPSRVTLMLGAEVDCSRATKSNWEERF